ncbi:sugar phosphate isomerase/epimerase family protein [Xylophilus sp. GOD-11R]|uniref:sugar phosphate isomerase/epimerase family protein n=1 Tax=Xylophilus sp. GOD-11R TaxID=3089814 RepID=UPI00298D265F|nr:sugar phosphate isomerase/epimerase family protein [Xylophilus sp. GOD-11R]WPB55862.1 sugar phosphate isomerase/epimerase family protein [Xylophilus sp. GOD-11R]
MTDRRNFFKTTSAAALGAALSGWSAALLAPQAASAAEASAWATDGFFLNTGILQGSPEQKFAAAHNAGFAQIELRKQDVADMPGGAAAVAAACKKIKLSFANYQVLSDFDGAPGNMRESKRAEATKILDDGHSAGAKLVLCSSSSLANVDAERVVADLQWLAAEAARRHLHVAYEPLAWGVLNYTLPQAWETLKKVNAPNIGLIVDPYHIFARNRTTADLDDIPTERLAVVQLCDAIMPVAASEYIDRARHHRLLPGEGNMDNVALLRKLREKKYRGPIGLEIYNDDLLAGPADVAARRAMDSLKKVLAEA